MTHFAPGQSIAMRGVFRGQVRTVEPVNIVADTEDEISFFWTARQEWIGTEALALPRDQMYPATAGEMLAGQWNHVPLIWERNAVLATTVPGSWAVVWHMWSADTGEFRCWYVNFQVPLARTTIGFDTRDLDLDLDIVVSPNGEWEWKDEDEYAARQADGLISAKEAEQVDKAAAGIIPMIEAREPPFDGSRIEWRPDPSWSAPTIPSDWTDVPIA